MTWPISQAEYGQGAYTQARRRSVHVPIRDGVRRAVDYFLPIGADGPLPTVYQSQRYVRAWRLQDGSVEGPVGVTDPSGVLDLAAAAASAEHYLAWFLMHGYAVVVADMRGAGASFGAEVEQTSLESCLDEYDIVEWIAAQPWSDGKVAMSGISYGAESQIMAAHARPPHLTAINPSAPEIDRFHGEAFTMGGIWRHGWQGAWYTGTRERNDAADAELELAICPVDDDPDGELLQEAVAERHGPLSLARAKAAQDEWEEGVRGERFWDRHRYSRAFQADGCNHMMTLADGLNEAGIPVFLTTGWLDLYCAGVPRFFNRLTVPKKLMIGPWAHGPRGTDDGLEGPRARAYVEALQVAGIRWFDYWLKGEDNGILDEPPVTYAVVRSRGEWEWRTSDRWPPAGRRSTQLFLGPPGADSVASINDGTLSFDRGVQETYDAGVDAYDVRYTPSTGTDNRWFAGGSITSIADYGDLREKIDVHGVTYTSPVLDEDVRIVGQPIVTLHATADCDDLDFVAFLELVSPQGRSEYLTEGMLRASHRTLGVPPYPYDGLPFPDSSSAVVAATPPLSAGVAELTFELYPVGAVVPAGSRIRLSIVHIDVGNTATPVLDPAPHVTLHRTGRHPSQLVLPLAGSTTT
jgi:putative CocE/NonD family hydrolase